MSSETFKCHICGFDYGISEEDVNNAGNNPIYKSNIESQTEHRNITIKELSVAEWKHMTTFHRDIVRKAIEEHNLMATEGTPTREEDK
jgi:hypothetical protein